MATITAGVLLGGAALAKGAVLAAPKASRAFKSLRRRMQACMQRRRERKGYAPLIEEEPPVVAPPSYAAAIQEIQEQFLPLKESRASKESVYIDLGMMEQTLNKAITWYTATYPSGCYKANHLKEQLDTIFLPLVDDGVGKINFSFGQLQRINQYFQDFANCATYSGTDKILELLQFKGNGGLVFNKPIVDDTTNKASSLNIIQYIIAYANETGLDVDLSFGGACATPQDMTFDGDAAAQATKLTTFLKTYGFKSVDFDLEGAGAIMRQNSAEDVNTFFETLNANLGSCGITPILTVAGAVSNGPTGILAPLFNLTNSFKKINLMLYSSSQFYVDAYNPTWGIKAWMQHVPADFLSFGFYDKIPYENPKVSDPDYSAEKYADMPANLSKGQAAAWTYLKVLDDSGLTPKEVKPPFIWTDNPNTIGSNVFMKDFHEYLAVHS